MKRFWLIRSVDFNLIIRCQYLVVDGSPTIILYPLVPTLMFVARLFIKFDVYCGFLLLFFQMIVVTRCECIYVADGPVYEDFIVDKWWEFEATEPEPYMASGGWVHQMRFSSINAFEKFKRITFMFEVNKILIIPIYPDISI